MTFALCGVDASVSCVSCGVDGNALEFVSASSPAAVFWAYVSVGSDSDSPDAGSWGAAPLIGLSAGDKALRFESAAFRFDL